MRKIIVLTLFFGLLGGTLHAQSRAERRAEEAEVARLITQLVETGRFRVDLTKINATNGQEINLSNNPSLIIRGDSVFSDLPYYGNNYNYNMSTNNNLSFRGEMTDYKFNVDRRNNSSVSFRVTVPEGVHRFSIRIMPNGLVDVAATPAGRQMIRYQGVISTKPVD